MTRRIAGWALPDWPVLLSILAGHVSFVGPRILDARSAAALPAPDRDRFAVPPGLVSHAWIQQRTSVDFDGESATVRRYLAERSLAADAAILLRELATLPYGTLISCYPYMVDDQRIVVRARLQGSGG